MSTDPTDAPSSTQIALREATRALAIGARGADTAGPASAAECRDLARDLAATLDGVVEVIRAAGVDVASSSTEVHALRAAVAQLSVGASLARCASGAATPTPVRGGAGRLVLVPPTA